MSTLNQELTALKKELERFKISKEIIMDNNEKTFVCKSCGIKVIINTENIHMGLGDCPMCAEREWKEI